MMNMKAEAEARMMEYIEENATEIRNRYEATEASTAVYVLYAPATAEFDDDWQVVEDYDPDEITANGYTVVAWTESAEDYLG